MLHLVAEFYRTPWALDPSTYATIESVLTRWAEGNRLNPEQIRAAVGDAPQAVAQRREAAAQQGQGQVAVIPVYGVLTHRAVDAENSSTPLASAERLAAQIRSAVANPDVSAIVLDVNSPGGSVFGVQELGDTIFALRGSKPIKAVANASAASGAYWIAAQADELIVTPSGMVGSIGVIMKHVNASEFYKQKGVEITYITSGKYKAEGNDSGPLDGDASEYMQAMSDSYYTAFTKAVAKGRGQPMEVVRGEAFGQGRMRTAREAVANGMADRVATLDAVVAELLKPAARSAARPLSAEAALAQVQALQANRIAV
jgi:signal peptide peptidase SppA